MKKVALLFGLIFIAVAGIAASREPVQIIVDQTGVAAMKKSANESRGACIAVRSGYEGFCSAHPHRDLCLAQGGLCRWQEY